jgi:hypothetical protein
MGYSAETLFQLWAMVLDLVSCYGHFAASALQWAVAPNMFSTFLLPSNL